MDERAFNTARNSLIGHGIELGESQYHPKSFGSWYITIETNPRRRLVWDGKEEWCIVQEETSELFNGMSVWKDCWLNKSPNSHAIATAVEIICELTRRK